MASLPRLAASSSDIASAVAAPVSTMDPNVWWWMALGISGFLVVLLMILLLLAWCCVYRPCDPNYHARQARERRERDAAEELTLTRQSSAHEEQIKQDAFFASPQAATPTMAESANESEAALLPTQHSLGFVATTPSAGNPLDGPSVVLLADVTHAQRRRRVFDTSTGVANAATPHNDEATVTNAEVDHSDLFALPRPRSIVVLSLCKSSSTTSTPNQWLHPPAVASDERSAAAQPSRRHSFLPTQRERQHSVKLGDGDNIPMVYATRRRVAHVQDGEAATATGVASATPAGTVITPMAQTIGGETGQSGAAVTVTLQRPREHVLESVTTRAATSHAASTARTVSADATAKAVERMIAIAALQTPVPLQTRPLPQLPALRSPPPEPPTRTSGEVQSAQYAIPVTPSARQPRRRPTPSSPQLTSAARASGPRAAFVRPAAGTSGSQKSSSTTSSPPVRPITAAALDVAGRGSEDVAASAGPAPMTIAPPLLGSGDAVRRSDAQRGCYYQPVRLSTGRSALEVRRSSIAGAQTANTQLLSGASAQRDRAGDRYDLGEGDDSCGDGDDSVLNSSVGRGGGGSEVSVATVPATRVAAARKKAIESLETCHESAAALHLTRETLRDAPQGGDDRHQQQQLRSGSQAVLAVEDTKRARLTKPPSVNTHPASPPHPPTWPQSTAAPTTTSCTPRGSTQASAVSHSAQAQGSRNLVANSTATTGGNGPSWRGIRAATDRTSLGWSADGCLQSSDLSIDAAQHAAARLSPSTLPRTSHDAAPCRPPLHRVTPTSLRASRVMASQTASAGGVQGHRASSLQPDAGRAESSVGGGAWPAGLLPRGSDAMAGFGAPAQSASSSTMSLPRM